MRRGDSSPLRGGQSALQVRAAAADLVDMTWVGGDEGLTREELQAIQRVLRLVALAAALAVATAALVYAIGVARGDRPAPPPLPPATGSLYGAP